MQKPTLEPGRFCYYLNPLPDERGEYRPSVVVEHEDGHYPCDFTYGQDKALAEDCVRELNARLGVDEERAAMIVASSMAAQSARHRRGGRRPRR